MPWSFGFTSYSQEFDGSAIAADETEFMLAMAVYQKRYHRRYPTWREALHVARCLGYRKVAEPVPVGELLPPTDEANPDQANPDREVGGDPSQSQQSS